MASVTRDGQPINTRVSILKQTLKSRKDSTKFFLSSKIIWVNQYLFHNFEAEKITVGENMNFWIQTYQHGKWSQVPIYIWQVI